MTAQDVLGAATQASDAINRLVDQTAELVAKAKKIPRPAVVGTDSISRDYLGVADSEFQIALGYQKSLMRTQVDILALVEEAKNIILLTASSNASVIDRIRELMTEALTTISNGVESVLLHARENEKECRRVLAKYEKSLELATTAHLRSRLDKTMKEIAAFEGPSLRDLQLPRQSKHQQSKSKRERSEPFCFMLGGKLQPGWYQVTDVDPKTNRLDITPVTITRSSVFSKPGPSKASSS